MKNSRQFVNLTSEGWFSLAYEHSKNNDVDNRPILIYQNWSISTLLGNKRCYSGSVYMYVAYAYPLTKKTLS